MEMYVTILLRSILTYCMQIDALKKAMESKLAKVADRESKLKSALVKNTELMDELDSLAAELDRTNTEQDVSQQVQKAQESVTQMKHLFSPPGITIQMYSRWQDVQFSKCILLTQQIVWTITYTLRKLHKLSSLN